MAMSWGLGHITLAAHAFMLHADSRLRFARAHYVTSHVTQSFALWAFGFAQCAQLTKSYHIYILVSSMYQRIYTE